MSSLEFIDENYKPYSVSVDDCDPQAFLPDLSDNMFFYPVEFASVNLPYRNPAKRGVVPPFISKTNNNVTLIMKPGFINDPHSFEGISAAYPYGKVPRLLLIYLATAVKVQKTNIIELGDTLQEFLGRIGLQKSGSAYRRVLKQTEALFSANFELIYKKHFIEGTGVKHQKFDVSQEFSLWFSGRDLKETTKPLFNSEVIISPEFYKSLSKRAFPVSFDALMKLNDLSKSPLALDIFLYLSFRLPKIENSQGVFVSFDKLKDQFGSKKTISTKLFKFRFVEALELVCNEIYPGARVKVFKDGLLLLDSPPLVASKEIKTMLKEIGF